MSYRHLENIDEQIIDATIKVGSENQANKLSTKTIAKLCGISEFVIYDHFKTKRKLIDAVSERVIGRAAAFLSEMVNVEKTSMTDIWNKMCEYLLVNYMDTEWLINYCNLFPRVGANCERNKETNSLIMDISKSTMDSFDLPEEDKEYLFSWSMRNIIIYCGLVLNDPQFDTPKHRELSRNCFLSGLKSFPRK